MNATGESLLAISLAAAVPLLIAQIKKEQWSDERMQETARESGDVIASKGDIILYKSPKKGETAKAFNALARGLACLSFAVGGVRFLGLHFEARSTKP